MLDILEVIHLHDDNPIYDSSGFPNRNLYVIYLSYPPNETSNDREWIQSKYNVGIKVAFCITGWHYTHVVYPWPVR